MFDSRSGKPSYIVCMNFAIKYVIQYTILSYNDARKSYVKNV